MKRIFSRFTPQANDFVQRPAQDYHIDQPVQKPVGKKTEKPVRESVKEVVNGSINKPDVSVNDPVPFTLEVTVIPVCKKIDTPGSVISKGLVRLSQAMETMNNLPTVKATPGETDAMVSFIINAVNILTTVPKKDRPNRVYPYHVYATRTGIATFFNLMGIIVKHLPNSRYSSTGAYGVLKKTFSAFIYFGIATLSTPAPCSASITAAIKDTSSYTSALSPEKASVIAEKTMEKLPPPERPDIRPLLSIFTSDQLAGLARRVAYLIDSHDPDDIVDRLNTQLFTLNINVPPQFCPCNKASNKFPICLCGKEPYSKSKYDSLCSRKLLPVV